MFVVLDSLDDISLIVLQILLFDHATIHVHICVENVGIPYFNVDYLPDYGIPLKLLQVIMVS